MNIYFILITTKKKLFLFNVLLILYSKALDLSVPSLATNSIMLPYPVLLLANSFAPTHNIY